MYKTTAVGVVLFVYILYRPTVSKRRIMSTKLDFIDQQSIRTDIPKFRPGDTVKVNVKVVEGNRSRIQAFQGVVISRSGAGVHETFTVRKISFGVGVERKFPLHAPSVDSIEVVSLGDVRRAKLYYLRELAGKKARIRERRINLPDGKTVVEEKVVEEKIDEKPTEDLKNDAVDVTTADVTTDETANAEATKEEAKETSADEKVEEKSEADKEDSTTNSKDSE